MLHNINLLPWREQLRNHRTQKFKRLVGLSVLVAIVIQALTGIFIDAQVSSHKDRLAVLNDEFVKIKQQQADLERIRSELTEVRGRQIKLVDLRARTDLISQFIESLPNHIPLGVFLVSLQLVDNKVDMVAISRETANIKTLLNALDASTQFSQVSIHSISNNDFEGQLYQIAEISFLYDVIVVGEGKLND